MSDFELIDVESLDYSDDQTWLYIVPDDSGQKVDIVDWSLSLDWPVYTDEKYLKTEHELYAMLDDIIKDQILAMPDKHKFDSRTYVKPKKRILRPSLQNIVDTPPPSQNNKYLTYNKYNPPLGPILRLKTFNVELNTENSNAVKEFAMKRRSLVQEDETQLENVDATLVSETSDRLSSDHSTTSGPINIDLSQPAHNLHNTFTKGFPHLLQDRPSLNMYQSGESLMRMSPPSLVSSMLMENSGNFNHESLDGRRSIASHRDSGIPTSGRDSIDPMMTSMTLSILDDKDMSTSFLSQTTYPDHDSLMDSLPPSLVSSVNSSYIVSNSSKPKDSIETNNIFSSTTFTHLEQSEKLLTGRPRHHMYNSFKRDSLRNSESYTKSKEEACQIDTTKVFIENAEKKTTPKPPSDNMRETITLHFSNMKFDDAEKENLNETFQKDDAFYKTMGVQKTVDMGKNSLNVTLDKQELNEIIQARQKLSLARKGLPNEAEKTLPNQIDISPSFTLTAPVQVTVPRKSMENASELLARRRSYANGNGNDRPDDAVREPPKRNATFKKTPPKPNAMDTTVVYLNNPSTTLTKDPLPSYGKEENIIDINSATLTLIDSADRFEHQVWGSQERAMVGSSESTDTGTFSSSSPPESVPDVAPPKHPGYQQVASTPLMSLRKSAKQDLMNLHTTISPIYDIVDDKSYIVKTDSPLTADMRSPRQDAITINTATLVKKTSAKRDILAAVGRSSPERKVVTNVQVKSPTGRIAAPCPVPAPPNTVTMGPPVAVPRKTGLPTSKLRQYSSHKELRLPVGGTGVGPVSGAPRPPGVLASKPGMVRRGVYASHPALSPTSSAPSAVTALRRDSYTIAVDKPCQDSREKSPEKVAPRPPLVRQGTETLRRERPPSNMMPPKELRRPSIPSCAPVRNQIPQSTSRISRPMSGPSQKPTPVAPPPAEPPRSSQPQKSRLPAPRRALRPPSVYSVAAHNTADLDHY